MLHVTDGNTYRVMSCLEAGRASGPASGLWYPHTGTTTHQKPHMHGGDLVQGHPADTHYTPEPPIADARVRFSN